ncbi:MAG TPA: hypothetical protein VMN58_00810 [Acidimicrobiales bacterium]|nr:hypothetical protein [Acidimicrobiales bacterium]
MVAGGLALVAVLLAMASNAGGVLGVRGGGFPFEFGFFERVQLGTRGLSVPLLLLVPLAIHLACTPGDPGRDPTDDGLPRMVITVATVIAAAFAFLVALRLVANLVGEELFIAAGGGVGTRAAAVVYDLAALVVAVAATAWGARRLQGDAQGPPVT